MQMTSVFGLQGLVPLLGVDMWEHAYYLQYNNVKADYLKEIWKIVNWKDVAARYSKAQSLCLCLSAAHSLQYQVHQVYHELPV